MKKILILLLAVSPILSKAQGVVGDALGDIADVALLVSITADVLDNTLSTTDKIQRINDDLALTQAMLSNPDFMSYTSSYSGNKVLRDVKTYARMTQMYALTLRNITRMTTELIFQVKAVKGKKLKNAADKIVAKIKSAASNTSIFGTQIGGEADASTVAQLEDNKYTASGQAYQGFILSILLELDNFNKKVDELHMDVLRSRGSITASFGVGVLLQSSSNMTLQQYSDNYKLRINEDMIKRNEAAIRQANVAREGTADLVRKASEELKRL